MSFYPTKRSFAALTMGSVVRSELQAVCRNAMQLKNTAKAKSKKKGRGELRPEYKFDYSKALPNRLRISACRSPWSSA